MGNVMPTIPPFTGTVSGLSHLPLVGSNGGRIDNHTAPAIIGHRVILRHDFGTEAQYIEAACQIDGDDLVPQIEGERAVFSNVLAALPMPAQLTQT